MKESITDKVFNKFVDKGKVPMKILIAIARKIKRSESLSDRETAIFTDTTSDIEIILKHLKK